MNNLAIDTCPRRRQAILETKKQLAKHKVVKVKCLTHSVVKMLKEIFPASPHHEDYKQIVTEVVHVLIKVKFFILSRNEHEIHIADEFKQVPQQGYSSPACA